jgi:hypothetical protein
MYDHCRDSRKDAYEANRDIPNHDWARGAIGLICVRDRGMRRRDRDDWVSFARRDRSRIERNRGHSCGRCGVDCHSGHKARNADRNGHSERAHSERRAPSDRTHDDDPDGHADGRSGQPRGGRGRYDSRSADDRRRRWACSW